MKRTAIMMLMLIVSLFLSVTSVFASHPYNDPGGRHMKTLHTTDSEYWCVDVTNTSRVTRTTAEDVIWDNLNHASGWNSITSDKVWLVGSYTESTNCSQMTASYLASRNFRYYVYDYPEDFNGSVISCSTNCVTRSDPTYVNNHTHYDYGVMNLKHTAVDSTRPHTISHETGHILGLKDPATTTGSDCPTNKSVMHSKYYGCSTDESYPTQYDKDSVTNEANKL